jgi:hypothetical protein
MWDLNAEKLVQKYMFADQGVVKVDLVKEESKEEQKEPL